MREANFEEANLDSRRQILTRFLRDLHASPGPDTPPDSTLTGPPLFRWSFISASNGLANRPDLLVARAHVAAFVLRVLRVDARAGRRCHGGYLSATCSRAGSRAGKF